MAKGYDGSILHVDLSTSTSRERLGGRAATEYALHVEGVAGVPRQATFSAEHDLERLRCAEPLRLLKRPHARPQPGDDQPPDRRPHRPAHELLRAHAHERATQSTHARLHLREGLRNTDDTLPARFLNRPIDHGRLAGTVIDRERFHAGVRMWAIPHLDGVR